MNGLKTAYLLASDPVLWWEWERMETELEGSN